MSLTYRSSTASSSGGAGDSLSVSKPSGVVDGDILIAAFYWETDTNTITPPAGWTLIRAKEQNTAPSPTIQLVSFWKRASSEPSSWSFVPSNNGQWRFYICVAYSGASGSGDQVDVTSGAHGTSGDISPPTITTTADSETVLSILNNWNGNNCSYSSGLCSTKRVEFAGLQIWEGTKTTAGAVGADHYVFGTEDWCAQHVAFKTDSGGSGVTGSGGVSFGALALVSTGAETFTGTGAASIGAPALAASAVETFVGSGGLAFGGPVLAGAGVETVTGTGAMSLGAPAPAGAGTVLAPVTGAGAAAVAGPGLQGAGVADVVGQGSAVFGAPALVGVGAETIALAGAILFSAPVLVGVAVTGATASPVLAVAPRRGFVAAARARGFVAVAPRP